MAQNVGVRAYLTPGATVGVGRQFVLNLEITGVRRVDRDPVLPDLAAFAQYLGSGASTSMQMSGGRTTVALTVQYRFQALVEGTFQIEPLQVEVGGQTYNTEALPLTVASEPSPGAFNGRTGAGGIASADLFVEAVASRTRVLVGEPLTVEYRIWTKLDVTSFSLTSEPEREGFWVEGLGLITQPQVEQRLRNGQQYTTALIQRVALIPTGAGQHTIEPLGIEAQVRVSRSSDPLDRLFGRSPLFGRATIVPAAVLSNSLTIEVDPLPAGRPEPFSGIVGSLAVTAEVDRDEVDANDAVTLTIRVSGEGNVRAIPEPVLDFPRDFEVFPPEVTESIQPSGAGLSGSKVFEYVLIPRTPGERAIPSVSMGYFDAATGDYRTARTDEIPLLVTGELNESPVSLQRVGVAQLREDIRFIRLGDGALRSVESFLFQGAAFWTLFLLPMVAVLGALGLRRHWDRLEGDVAYARGRRAGRVAKKRLADAQGLVQEGDSRAFFAEVANALRGFVADRLNVAEAGMQVGELRVSLAGRGVSTEATSEFLDCLEQCDRQRFAPAGAELEERVQFLERAGAAMTMLDGELR